MKALKGCDMIVPLSDLPELPLLSEKIKIRRAISVDKDVIMAFVRDFNERWCSEAEYALLSSPPTCFIAVENGKLLGFACYDATAKGFFWSHRCQRTGTWKAHWTSSVDSHPTSHA